MTRVPGPGVALRWARLLCRLFDHAMVDADAQVFPAADGAPAWRHVEERCRRCGVTQAFAEWDWPDHYQQVGPITVHHVGRRMRHRL